MVIHTYNVFDLKINDYIGVSVSVEIVSALTGLNKKNISGYVINKYAYKKRYKVTYHEKPIVDKPKSNNIIPQETLVTMCKWENMRKAAQILKDGKGKIVCRGGKRFVERVR